MSELKTIPHAIWGEMGTPLIPASIISEIGHEVLPKWITQDLGLSQNSKIAALGGAVDEATGKQIPKRVLNYVIHIVDSKKASFISARVTKKRWPLDLEESKIPWKNRTRNALHDHGYLRNPSLITNITYQDLFSIPGIGVVSILDFVTALEAAITYFDEQLRSSSVQQYETDKWEDLIEAEWIYQVSSKDPRFHDLLSFTTGTLFELLDDLTSPDLSASSVWLKNSVEGVIPEIRKRIEEIERQSLDGSLTSYLSLLSELEGDHLKALIRRWGFDGKAPGTLAEAGDIVGITRERIRQIEKKIVKRAPKHSIYMPALESAIELLERNVPISLERAATLLVESGVSSQPFSPKSVLTASKLCRKETSLEIRKIKGEKILDTSNDPLIHKVIRIARSQATASGASNIFEVSAELNHKGFETTPEEVLKALMLFSEFHFLEGAASLDDVVEDGNTTWFWCTSAPLERNRLRNITRKVLAVKSPISVRVLREGVRRYYRYRGAGFSSRWTLRVPPMKVLQSFYTAHKEFEVSGESVACNETLDIRLELGEAEQILCSAFSATPSGVLDRKSLAQYCLSRGMNESTFNTYLSYSPFIEHLGVDIWSLKGHIVDITAVEALRASNANKSKENRVRDYGWTEDGKIWILIKLPALQRTFVAGIPSDVKRYLAGKKFKAVSEDGKSSVNITVGNNGMSWGYGPYLSRFGADEGDYMAVEFNIKHNLATLLLGGDEILDTYLD